MYKQYSCIKYNISRLLLNRSLKKKLICFISNSLFVPYFAPFPRTLRVTFGLPVSFVS
jgi:hypothetical protein